MGISSSIVIVECQRLQLSHRPGFRSFNPQFRLEKLFVTVFGGFISPGSFIPLFPSLIDLPILVVALEKVERSSGSLVESSIASIQKSAAPEMFALMDEAYTGSTIGDGGADSESEDSTDMTVDPIFIDLLKDENDGLSERHWTSPAMAATLQSVINSPQSDRLKEALKIAPRLFDSYLASAVHDANDSFICALILQLMARYSLFPDKMFSYEVHRRLVEFILAAFNRSPHSIALLKKPIVNSLEKLMTTLQRLSWRYNFVGLSGNLEVVVELTKMQLVNFLRAWNYSCTKTFLPVVWIRRSFPQFWKFWFEKIFGAKAPLFCGDRNSETCHLSS